MHTEFPLNELCLFFQQVLLSKHLGNLNAGEGVEWLYLNITALPVKQGKLIFFLNIIISKNILVTDAISAYIVILNSSGTPS